MFEIIMSSVILTFAIALYASFLTAATPKQNIILNLTLPKDAQKDSRVLEITGQFKRAILLVNLAALAFGIPLIFIPLPSILLILFSVWAVVAILVNNRILFTFNRRLAALKKQNQWFVGNTHTITIDVEVSRAKNTMPVSRLWFLPSLAASLALLAFGLVAQETLIPGIIALGGNLLFLALYSVSSRERARAYCEETEINMACHKLSIRLWTLCWVTLAGVQTLLMIGLSLFLDSPALFLSIMGLGVSLNIAIIILTHRKVRTSQNLLLEGAKTPIYVDEDYYWQGSFYNNPNDSRTMVEKRIGYGQTINIATKKGKIAYYGLIIGLPALLLAMFLTFVSFDTAEFDLTIADNQVYIHAPMYKYDFSVSEIRSVTTIDNLPHGTRTNGAATSKYNLGNFRLNSYGASKMYVYKDQQAYVVVELPDLYVFITGKTPERTQEIYEILLENTEE